MSWEVNEVLFSTKEVARVTGASYRQLDYWCRTGVLSPMFDGGGSGSRRLFSSRDVVEARLVVVLRNGGVDLLTAGFVVRELGGFDIDPALLLIVTGDAEVRLVNEADAGAALVSLVGPLFVVSLADVLDSICQPC